MLIKNKFKVLFAIAILFAACLGLYFISFNQNRGEASTSPTTPPSPVANNGEKKVPGKKNPTSITDNDRLDEVKTSPAPEEWTPYTDSVLATNIPSDWKAEGGPTSSSVRDPGKSLYTYSATFGTSDDNRERPCSFAVQSLTYLPSIETKEGLDTGDDGKLTDPPGRIWTDIIERDHFTYNSSKAVRYYSSSRLSTRTIKQYGITYFVDGGEKTYTFGCKLDDVVTAELADQLFTQLTIN
ncbi:hypothetical protein JNJ66_00010 [Candidatus Saccharibacteria bacterium]|nr:hypothetical protein [Candidatus Saccharibacteria bacterium]